MDLDQLRTFVAVADCGSFAAAARRLDNPKSTVAKRLGQLEQSLSVRLVERGRRAVRLTDEGRDILGPARNVLANAEEVEAAARLKTGSLVGRIRVSVPTLLGQTILPAMLGKFAREHPAISLDVVAEDRYVDVVADGYDCAVRLGTGADGTLIRKKLAQSTLILVAPAHYLEAASIEHPRWIEKLETIGFEPRSSQHLWPLSNGSETFELKPNCRLSIGSLPAIVGVMESHAAVALLPEFLVREQLNSGKHVRVCPDWRGERCDISVVFSSKDNMPPRIRAFVDHLAHAFGGLDLAKAHWHGRN